MLRKLHWICYCFLLDHGTPNSHKLARRYGDIIQAIEVERFRIVGASYELQAVIILKDGAKLFVKDYLFLDGTRKYAYHWQDREGQLRSRWDNAPQPSRVLPPSTRTRCLTV